MKSIKFKRPLEYFRDPLQLPPELSGGFMSGFYTGRYRYNRVSMLALLLLACLVTRGFDRESLVFVITMLAYFGITFLKTRKIIQSVEVVRTAPDRSYENAELKVHYKVSNRSPFNLRGFSLQDGFSGSNAPVDQVFVQKTLPPGTPYSFEVAKKCDGGMGDHIHGPLSLTVTDFLGLFEFTAEFSKPDQTKVLPAIQALPEFQISGTADSNSYGVYDLSERGSSVNFMGIREYRTGDPLKLISWRLSLKASRPLIKEFEKVVNSQITILLDLDPAHHVGEGSDSTWEWTKDIALSLASQQLALGNDIQVITQQGLIEFGRGESHIQFLAMKLMNLTPQTIKSSQDLVDRYLPLIPRSSFVFYIGPSFTVDIPPTLKSLPRLKGRSVISTCILLDAHSFTRGKLHGPMLHATGAIWTKPRVRDLLSHLLRAEIPIYQVPFPRPLAKSLARRLA